MTSDRTGAGLIKRAANSWLRARIADKPPSEWVHDRQIEWLTTGQFESLWKFILRLCEIVDPADKSTIELIGVDPMFELFLEFPDQAIEAIEHTGDQQPVLIEALSVVDAESDEIQARIEAVVARYGAPRD